MLATRALIVGVVFEALESSDPALGGPVILIGARDCWTCSPKGACGGGCI